MLLKRNKILQPSLNIRPTFK